MAAGAPVIAWPEGSVPEVLEESGTGALFSTLDEAAAAVRAIASFDRRRIGKEFETAFTADVMAARYLAAYQRLLSNGPSAHSFNVKAQGAAASAERVA
jgi:glycosyltransferase involved in cell wall biosynthesis